MECRPLSQGPPVILISDADVLIDYVAEDIGVLEWSNYDCPFVKKHYDI